MHLNQVTQHIYVAGTADTSHWAPWIHVHSSRLSNQWCSYNMYWYVGHVSQSNQTPHNLKLHHHSWCASHVCTNTPQAQLLPHARHSTHMWHPAHQCYICSHLVQAICWHVSGDAPGGIHAWVRLQTAYTTQPSHIILNLTPCQHQP